MATSKHSTLKSASTTDGRRLAAVTLARMDRINSDCRPSRTRGIAESRDVLFKALTRFCALPEKEQRRFVSTMEHYLGSVMQGGAPDADCYLHMSVQKVEAQHARYDTMERRAA